MKIVYKEGPGLNEFSKLIQDPDSEPDIKSILILSCDSNNYNINDLNSVLKQTKKKVFSGIFPEIIYMNNKYKKGIIAVGFSQEAVILEIPNLSGSDIEISKKVEDILKKDASYIIPL